MNYTFEEKLFTEYNIACEENTLASVEYFKETLREYGTLSSGRRRGGYNDEEQ